MRDRLIELINQRIDNKTWTVSDLADHLLANGVIVPPCKVGDIVYDTAYNKITELIIYGIEFAQTATDTRLRLIAAENNRHLTICGNISDIIKTVFLTREEAEAKLKGEQ